MSPRWGYFHCLWYHYGRFRPNVPPVSLREDSVFKASLCSIVRDMWGSALLYRTSDQGILNKASCMYHGHVRSNCGGLRSSFVDALGKGINNNMFSCFEFCFLLKPKIVPPQNNSHWWGVRNHWGSIQYWLTIASCKPSNRDRFPIIYSFRHVEYSSVSKCLHRMGALALETTSLFFYAIIFINICIISMAFFETTASALDSASEAPSSRLKPCPNNHGGQASLSRIQRQIQSFRKGRMFEKPA